MVERMTRESAYTRGNLESVGCKEMRIELKAAMRNVEVCMTTI